MSYKLPLTRDQISKQIFGKPFKDISLKDCEIVNTHYFAQPGVDPNEGLKAKFSVKETVAAVEGARNWCQDNRDKILTEINNQMDELKNSCPQETCPMSNLEKGKYDALKNLKEFIEGMKW